MAEPTDTDGLDTQATAIDTTLLDQILLDNQNDFSITGTFNPHTDDAADNAIIAAQQPKALALANATLAWVQANAAAGDAPKEMLQVAGQIQSDMKQIANPASYVSDPSLPSNILLSLSSGLESVQIDEEAAWAVLHGQGWPIYANPLGSSEPNVTNYTPDTFTPTLPITDEKPASYVGEGIAGPQPPQPPKPPATPNGTYVVANKAWNQINNDGTSLTPSNPPPQGATGYMGVAPPGYAGPIDPSLQATFSGAIGNLVIGAGPWPLGGTATIQSITDEGAIIPALPGANLNVGTVAIYGSSASVEVAQVGAVIFNGPNETLKIDGSGMVQTISVNGLVQGDVIDFPNYANLTLGYGTSVQANANGIGYSVIATNGTLYSGSKPIAVLNPIKSPDITALEPVGDGHGGTEIIVDPTNKAVADPTGNQIDWSFIHANEGGGWYWPYVIPNTYGGFTVATGVDLGVGPDSNAAAFKADFPANSFSSLASDDPNLDYIYDTLLAKKPSLGNAPPDALGVINGIKSSGQAAIGSIRGNQTVLSVSLDQSQINTLTTDAETQIYNKLVTAWANSKNSALVPFASLPAPVQTVLMDLSYNSNFANLQKSDFWTDAANYEQTTDAIQQQIDLKEMVSDLNAWAADDDASDELSARLKNDAAYITSKMPIKPVPPPVPALKQSNPNPLLMTVSSSIKDTTTQMGIEPAGASSYTLTANAGSPLFATIQMPDGDITASDIPTAYSFSYAVNGTWSAPQTLQPLQTLTLPAGVNGLMVTTLDANGAPYVSASAFTFLTTFATAGLFTGTVTAGSHPQYSHFQIVDNTTNTSDIQQGWAYDGPVAGLQWQYSATITTDNLNITAVTPNSFIQSSAGDDGLNVSGAGGNNVLDGGGGSNFLVGGTGNDTFFLNDRAATAPIWDTVSGFHAGDTATLWGVSTSLFSLSWADGFGASGYTGLTLNAAASGKPAAALTLAGYTSADLKTGRLTTAFGTDPNAGPYMVIQGH